MGFARWVFFSQGSLSTRLLPSLAVWALCSEVDGQGLVFEKKPFVGFQGILPALHIQGGYRAPVYPVPPQMIEFDMEILCIPCHHK